jgi:hypothetical protein
MPLRPTLFALATTLASVASFATAGVVDMAPTPPAQSVAVGALVQVKVVVNTQTPGGQPWDALDAIVSWDPTKLTLVGTTQVGAGAPFFLTGFLPDPDGINTNLNDGTVLFTALGIPGSSIIAPPAPGSLVVTTFQFIALTPTPATDVDFLPSVGVFGKTRVLLAGFNVTGDTSPIATIEILPACPASDHDCYSTGIPGCTDTTCCDTVCSIDVFCCDTFWDSVCVGEATSLCEGCGNPTAGDCCGPNGTPYCDDADCCAAVCAFDSFCCSVEWDQICAEETIGVAGCDCTTCEVSDQSCFEVHATPGCATEGCCNDVCVNDPDCCVTSWDQACKDAANALCADCGDPANGSCFCPHPEIGCNNATCCRTVCEVDPFCCEVEWDSICASEANLLCDCRDDFDNNGVIDGADLAFVLGAWGTSICPYDIDGSGSVDGADIGILLGDWGPCN